MQLQLKYIQPREKSSPDVIVGMIKCPKRVFCNLGMVNIRVDEKGPDISGVVVKSVKEERILPSTDPKPSNSQEI
jgi:hypothetical protein